MGASSSVISDIGASVLTNMRSSGVNESTYKSFYNLFLSDTAQNEINVDNLTEVDLTIEKVNQVNSVTTVYKILNQVVEEFKTEDDLNNAIKEMLKNYNQADVSKIIGHIADVSKTNTKFYQQFSQTIESFLKNNKITNISKNIHDNFSGKNKISLTNSSFSKFVFSDISQQNILNVEQTFKESINTYMDGKNKKYLDNEMNFNSTTKNKMSTGVTAAIIIIVVVIVIVIIVIAAVYGTRAHKKKLAAKAEKDKLV